MWSALHHIFLPTPDLKESLKNRLIFSFSCSRKTAGGRKNFPSGKNECV
jgi:hypothetical protein